MMPLSLSISIVLIYILYLICPLKCHFLYYKFQQSYYNNKYIGFHQKKNLNFFYFLFPLNIAFITIFILVVINDIKVNENFKNDNNKIKPIVYFYSCSKKIINTYNAYNIYDKNGKICGKDNNGNYLYFPENEECPINDVYLGYKDNEKLNYSKIYCNDNDLYLYFTNTNTEGKIITDLAIDTSNLLLYPKYYSGKNINNKN